MISPSSPPLPARPGPPPPVASSPSATSMVRVVGYGLFGMFLLDLPAIAVAYLQAPLDPQVDGTIVAQVLERAAVPLIAFAMIFGWEAHDLPRWERLLRKSLSQLMLVGCLLSLALGALAISSGIRQYDRAATVVDFRANQRVSALTTLGKSLATLNGQALAGTFASVVHPAGNGPLPPADEMRKKIAAALPNTIEGVYNTAKVAKSTGKRDEYIAMGKYALDGLITAGLFFVLWEASYSARTYRIFRQKNAPTLGVEGAVIDRLGSLGRKMEDIRLVPNFEEYAWYRRIRRKWRHRGDHKHR
jgi:hypothetical protein